MLVQVFEKKITIKKEKKQKFMKPSLIFTCLNNLFSKKESLLLLLVIQTQQ